MGFLKADLHAHCADDPCDTLPYSAETLIRSAASRGIDVLSITCHETVVHNEYLAEFAFRQGVLLLPGMEATIEGKHVLIINPSRAHRAARTFRDLHAAGKGDAYFIAPHPFYPTTTALGRRLFKHRELFDAVEYHGFYRRGLNFNRRARIAARRLGLPLIGNSDTHLLPYSAATHTVIDAEHNVDAVLAALREGRFHVQTRPLPFPAFRSMMGYMVGQAWQARTTQYRNQEVGQ